MNFLSLQYLPHTPLYRDTHRHVISICNVKFVLLPVATSQKNTSTLLAALKFIDRRQSQVAVKKKKKRAKICCSSSVRDLKITTTKCLPLRYSSSNSFKAFFFSRHRWNGHEKIYIGVHVNTNKVHCFASMKSKLK